MAQPIGKPQPRFLGGWYVSAAILLLLISAAITTTFTSADPKSKSLAAQVSHLETYVRSRADRLKTKVKLEDVADSVELSAKTDPSAALLFTETQTELGRPVPPEVLTVLATAKPPGIAPLAKAYAVPPPGPEELTKIAQGLGKTTFLRKLAQVQLLEKAGDKQIRTATFGARIKEPGLQTALIFGAAFCLFALLSVGLLFFYGDSRSRGLLKPVGHPLEPRSAVEADALAMRAAQLLSIFVLAELVQIDWSRFLPRSAAMAMTVITPDVILVAGALILTRFKVLGQSLSLRRYGVDPQAVKPGILWGLGGLFGAMPLVLAAGAVFLVATARFFPTADHPLNSILEDRGNAALVSAALIVATLAAPIFEELLFRGTLLPAVSWLFKGKPWQAPAAIAISSLCFAACHPQGIPVWGVLGGIGAVNAMLCYQTGSILPGMVLHALWNGAVLATTLLNQG